MSNQTTRWTNWLTVVIVIQGVWVSPAFSGCESTSEATHTPHATFDALLKKHVDEHGWIDYKALHDNRSKLDEYIASVGKAPIDKLPDGEKLALLINAYNAFTLRLILDHWDDGDLASIKDIPDKKRWDYRRWNVGGHTWSLNDIEHDQIRPNFKEPRIHFALVCAAVGCPKLRNEAFQADRLDAQLEDQTQYIHRHDRWFRLDLKRGRVYLTKLYDWYGGDFGKGSNSILQYVARYSPELKKALEKGRRFKIHWLEYSWKLNDKSNKPNA